MGASFTSPVTNIQFLDHVCIQLNFTGTPAGTFDVQVSADYFQDSQGNVQNPGNWISLPLSPTPAAAGAPNNIMIELFEMSEPFVRVVYTRTSGTGTFDMYIGAKVN
jgi:hypothetical protein